MPPRTINPQLLRLLQGMPSFQGLPQTPQQISAPAPIEQPDLAQQLQQQPPPQTSTAELGQKDILTNKLRQQYMTLLSDKIPSAPDDPYTRTGKLFKKGGIGGILGGVASLAASPLGASIIGMMMDPYEGAGLYKGAAAGEALRQQQTQRVTQEREKKLAEIRQYLEHPDFQTKLKQAGELQTQIAEIKTGFEKTPQELADAAALKAGAIAQVKQPFALEQVAAKYDLKSEYDKDLADTKLITTIKAENRAEKRGITKEVRKKIGQLDQIEGLMKHLKPQLDKIKLEHIPLLGESPVGEKISGLGRVVKSFVGADPSVKAYRVEVKSILGQLARGLSQEVGVLTDKDIGRQSGFVPGPSDTIDERKAKWKNMFEVINMLKDYARRPLSEQNRTREGIKEHLRQVGLVFTEDPNWTPPTEEDIQDKYSVDI